MSGKVSEDDPVIAGLDIGYESKPTSGDGVKHNCLNPKPQMHPIKQAPFRGRSILPDEFGRRRPGTRVPTSGRTNCLDTRI
ncbi:hypothetical protein ACVJBD_000815 [Rhizobium mongolense]